MARRSSSSTTAAWGIRRPADRGGNEVLADGETIDDLGAYAIDFAVEGVTGVT